MDAGGVLRVSNITPIGERKLRSFVLRTLTALELLKDFRDLESPVDSQNLQRRSLSGRIRSIFGAANQDLKDLERVLSVIPNLELEQGLPFPPSIRSSIRPSRHSSIHH